MPLKRSPGLASTPEFGPPNGSDFADTPADDSGNNRLDGGDGFDRAIYAGSDAGVNVNLATGTALGGDAEGDSLTGIENLTGSAHRDTLTNIQNLTGSAHNDTLTGDDGNNRLDGGLGIDRAIYAGSNAAVSVNLATGTALGGHAQGDTLTNIQNLTGSAHNDTLTGDDGNNRLDGGLGIDRAIYAGSNAAVSVNLGAGTARGGHAQGDTLTNIQNLTGSVFADTLTGGTDESFLDGGAGRDVFVFKATDGVVGDEIDDFEDGMDSIRILDGSVSFGDLTITDSGGNASVTWGQNNTLTFYDLDRTLLTADDFAFV